MKFFWEFFEVLAYEVFTEFFEVLAYEVFSLWNELTNEEYTTAFTIEVFTESQNVSTGTERWWVFEIKISVYI